MCGLKPLLLLPSARMLRAELCSSSSAAEDSWLLVELSVRGDCGAPSPSSLSWILLRLLTLVIRSSGRGVLVSSTLSGCSSC